MDRFVQCYRNRLTFTGRPRLSGDTAIHSEMKSVDNEFHKANLMVLNLGYSAITAQAGACAANELVRPAGCS
jgi:hypothetical protein